jgi:hypothetical protein
MTNLDIVTFTHNQLAIGKYGNISGPNQGGGGGGGLSNLLHNSSDEKLLNLNHGCFCIVTSHLHM